MAGVRTVHIVLDTNSLFTDAEDKLLASNISRFILEDTKHLGLQIIWHLPDVVKGERKRQMLERASILVAKLGKLEALLGTPLGIDPATLEKKVDEAIAKQIKHHNLEELRADNSKIDWDQLIQNSVERNAPFSQSTEKGFRDAIILESFFQLIGSQSGTTWRAFLVSNDDRMTEAAEQRIKTQFASTVADLDELKSAINAIPAHVSKAELSKLIPAAHAYFFEPDQHAKPLYAWGVKKRIWESEQTQEPPGPAFQLAAKWLYVSPPTFLERKGPKFKFRTRIRAEATWKKKEIVPKQEATATTVAGTSEQVDKTPATQLELATWEVISKHIFAVEWVAEQTAAGEFTSASEVSFSLEETTVGEPQRVEVAS